MAPKPLNLGGFPAAAGLAAAVALELLARWAVPRLPLPPLAILGGVRLLQIAGMLWPVIYWQSSLAAIGWAPARWARGVWLGSLWSLGFAVAAGLGMLAVHLSGSDPLALVRSPLGTRPAEVALFFVVGGLIAPVAEEICFRGLLYTFFRRWGIAAALVASTAIFVALHSTSGLPITQAVGGLIFALAYEATGNLTVPMTIHILGNLALFCLSLPLFR